MELNIVFAVSLRGLTLLIKTAQGVKQRIKLVNLRRLCTQNVHNGAEEINRIPSHVT